VRETGLFISACSGDLDGVEVFGAGLHALKVSIVAIQVSFNFMTFNFPVVLLLFLFILTPLFTMNV
jgi:hypothetical protein